MGLRRWEKKTERGFGKGFHIPLVLRLSPQAGEPRLWGKRAAAGGGLLFMRGGPFGGDVWVAPQNAAKPKEDQDVPNLPTRAAFHVLCMLGPAG